MLYETDSLLRGLGFLLAFFGIIGLIFYVLNVVAYWRIFEKAGEKGWKAFIPIYSQYVVFKISWETRFFWIMFIIMAVAQAFSSIEVNSWMTNVFGIASVAFYLAAFAVSCISEYTLAKSFGKGVGFTVGLILLPTVFSLILAFDGSVYNGPVTVELPSRNE